MGVYSLEKKMSGNKIGIAGEKNIISVRVSETYHIITYKYNVNISLYVLNCHKETSFSQRKNCIMRNTKRIFLGKAWKIRHQQFQSRFNVGIQRKKSLILIRGSIFHNLF